MKGGLQAKAFSRFHLPGGGAERGAPVQAVPQGLEFQFVQGGVYQAGPLWRFWHWTCRKPACWIHSHLWLRAGPFPVLALRHQIRPQVVPLDISQHCQIMVVTLHRKGLEAYLPDMSPSLVMVVISPDMGGR
ncbi:MAG: hypothetical protein DWH82_11145 [Planctomycetota bacterium]|nr:MAG: hypothetical protein DWH82_11145 [Planctomycetota bacterium]